MLDFLVALGLVFVIEGLLFAAFPAMTKRSLMTVMDAPEAMLRTVGLGCAVVGLLVVWLVRGLR